MLLDEIKRQKGKKRVKENECYSRAAYRMQVDLRERRAGEERTGRKGKKLSMNEASEQDKR